MSSLSDENTTVVVVQRQIDTLREQLYKLNDMLNSNIAAQGGEKKRGGKLTDLTAEEHQIIARNEALRAERTRLENELKGRDPPELMDKKNALREVEKSVSVLQREVEQLTQVRDSKQEAATKMQNRHDELQSLQASLVADQVEYRQQQREALNKIKEVEKKLLVAHGRLVTLNERAKHGVPAAEADKLTAEVAQQEQQIEAMEIEVRKRRHAQQQAMMRQKPPKAPTSEKEREVNVLTDQLKQLQEVLASRDAELKRSYDYAGKKLRAQPPATAVAAGGKSPGQQKQQ